MKKRLILPGLGVILMLAACTPSAPVTNEPMPSSDAAASEQTIDLEASSSAPMEQPASAAASSKREVPPATSPSAELRVIDMTVTNFAFSPASVTVKKGEKVQLRLKGVDGTHGLAIPELGINVSLTPGQIVMIDVPTGKTGTFLFFCSIPCGPGHRDMRGAIVIE